MIKELKCQKCQIPIMKEDRRFKQPIQALNNAILEIKGTQAPRIRCQCGQIHILLRGSL